MVYMDPILTVRLFGIIIGLLLFYYAFRLFRTLENKELAISMIFLHKKRAINLFGLLVVAAIFIFLTGIDFIVEGGGLDNDILLDLDALTLLVFTFLLNKLMKGNDKRWTS